MVSHMTNHDSFLLSFEGIEGSGKSTQIQMLTKKLEASNYTVKYFREPGGTSFGEKLRSTILESTTPINPLAEANLFAASRAQLLSEKVLPLLGKKNHIVILDRYLDSSIAYQGMARGLGIDTILDLHKHSPLDTRPICTFYLQIDIETSMQRQSSRGNEKDYFEKENQNFYQSLIDGYELSSKRFPDRIQVINGKSNQDSIHQNILQTLKEKTGIEL